MFEIDYFVSSTGNFSIVTLVRTKKLKNISFTGNSGDFDTRSTYRDC